MDGDGNRARDEGVVGRQKVMSRRNAKGDGKMARKRKERKKGESSSWLLIKYKQWENMRNIFK